MKRLLTAIAALVIPLAALAAGSGGNLSSGQEWGD